MGGSEDQLVAVPRSADLSESTCHQILSIDRHIHVSSIAKRIWSPSSKLQEQAFIVLERRVLGEPWLSEKPCVGPLIVSEEVHGLYLTGAGTHPGAGLPGVVSSAEVLAQLVPDPETVR